MLKHRVRALLSTAGVVIGLGLAPVIPAATAHQTPHHTAHHHRSVHNRIPQHNGGDRDADNNGGPSDGDGNL